MASTDTSPSDATPEFGLLTWDAEGMEGGRFHSRVFCVPSASSGLTIGRGYDMKEKTAATIAQDLAASGVSSADAALISRAAGLSGAAASKFIADNKLEKFEISKPCQKNLFLIIYGRLKADVERISAKPDVVAAYGACDWSRIDPAVIDLVVDLRFRGDYNGSTRALVQTLVARSDLPGLARAMKVRADWANVPNDRFQRRCNFLDQALAARRSA
jgi:hypothetical protein